MDLQPIKKLGVYSIFGKHYGDYLTNFITGCCSDIGTLCNSIKSCIGISPEGNPNLVLNQQGDWVQSSAISIGNPVNGDPNEFLYTDTNGNLYQDGLASRDSVTNETYIGYRTGAGQFTNAFHLGNILNGAISDGAGLQRHDASGDNFTFIGTVDMTPFGGGTNELLGAYEDFTNGIFATTKLSNIESAFNYSNSVTGTDGHIVANSTRISIEHTDNSTYDSQIQITDTIDLKTDGTGGRSLFRVSNTFIEGGGGGFYFYADTIDDTFCVKGRLPITGTPSGSLLFVDLPNAVSTLGDYNEQMSHIKVVADVANGNAYVDGLAKTVPNWTPTILTDGFTGTGLNDMNYDSTVTYTGTYPNTYTATIVSVTSVYMYLTSITTPGFTVGDTVTDGASTGTIIAGSDGDGFIIIQPIIDTGWTSATSITDISSGAASSVSGLFYTDTMSWSSTAGGSGILIPTSSFIDLGDGLTVKFVSQTGHTIGDSWTWEMIANYTYSKMALFDGFNGIQVIGDVNQALDGIRTEWVHGTTKGGSITEHLGEQGAFSVSSNAGNIFYIVAVDTSTSGDVAIYNPYSGSGYDLFRAEFDSAGLGIGIRVSDTGSQRSVLIGDDVGVNNGTNIFVDDIAETITLTASHISAPLSAYADDADAGTNGVVTGELYQTDGTGSAPLNIAGIVMIKQ